MIDAEMISFKAGQMMVVFLIGLYIIQVRLIYKKRFKLVHLAALLLPELIIGTIGIGVTVKFITISNGLQARGVAAFWDAISVALCNHLLYWFWYRKRPPPLPSPLPPSAPPSVNAAVSHDVQGPNEITYYRPRPSGNWRTAILFAVVAAAFAAIYLSYQSYWNSRSAARPHFADNGNAKVSSNHDADPNVYPKLSDYFCPC